MNINYSFHQYRVSGEQAETWSVIAYKLCSINAGSMSFSGFRIGHILYLHHIQGMSAKEIKQTGYDIAINMIKSILKGFGRRASRETKEAYEIAMYMVNHEPDVLEKMYQINISKQ